MSRRSRLRLPRRPEHGWDLRHRLGSAWRWPLYSPARFVTTIAAAFFLVVVAPGWFGQSPEASSGDLIQVTGSSAWVPPQDPTVAMTNASASAADQATPGQESAPGSSSSSAASQTDPAAMAAAWATAWCTQDPTEPADGNLVRSAPMMTSAARRQAEAQVPSAESWGRTQAAGLSTSCSPVQVTMSAAGTDGQPVAVISATRQIVDPSGQVLSSQPFVMTHRMSKGSDGRYLVDTEVTAG